MTAAVGRTEVLFEAMRERDEAIARAERAEAALAKVNAIRNSIIGSQTVNWSEHVYPLVAALEAAGFPGLGYDEARQNVGTLIGRASQAETRIAALQRAVEHEITTAEGDPADLLGAGAVSRLRAALVKSMNGGQQ